MKMKDYISLSKCIKELISNIDTIEASISIQEIDIDTRTQYRYKKSISIQKDRYFIIFDIKNNTRRKKMRAIEIEIVKLSIFHIEGK